MFISERVIPHAFQSNCLLWKFSVSMPVSIDINIWLFLYSDSYSILHNCRLKTKSVIYVCMCLRVCVCVCVNLDIYCWFHSAWKCLDILAMLANVAGNAWFSVPAIIAFSQSVARGIRFYYVCRRVKIYYVILVCIEFIHLNLGWRIKS